MKAIARNAGTALAFLTPRLCAVRHPSFFPALFAALFSITSAAVTRYVWQGGSHAAPYTTWATAATNISAANTAAAANDEIIVTNGIYAETAVINLDDNGLVLRSVNGPNVTIIDGRAAQRVLFSNNNDVQVHGFTIRNGSVGGNGAGIFINAANTLVSNCIIIGNVTTGNDRQGAGVWADRTLVVDCLIVSNTHTGGGTPLGGGAYCQNTARLLRCHLQANTAMRGAGACLDATTADSCVFDLNTANDRGGGVYAYGEASFANCTFYANTAASRAGGVFARDAASFTNCVFDANLQTVSTVSSDGGGALYLENSTTVTACTFRNNQAVHYGGAIYVNNTAARILHSTFIANRTTLSGESSGGGAVYLNHNGFLTSCLLSRNLAMNDGGGVFMYNGGFVDRCRFVNNTAADWGGGLVIYTAGAVTNSLFYDNIADEGGGIYNYDGGGRVHSCTVVKNTANLGAGGVDCGGDTIVRNSIVYDNSAPVHTNYRMQTTAARWRNCCTWPAVTGTPDDSGNMTSQPRFVAAAFNHYWLATNSPCINTGSNETWMTTASDLDGRSRIVNAIVDIGAYEHGALVCALFPNRRAGHKPLTVDFTSYVSGTNTTGLVYFWDFDFPSGTDLSGAGMSAPSWTYTTDGLYRVCLVVSNTAGETASYLATDFIIVVSEPRHVATNGPHIAPFTSWETAASNIESAVAISFDYMQVFVSAGTYRVTAPVLLTNAVEVISVCGPQSTIVNGASTSRCFYIATDALVSGFTISNGRAAGPGIAAYGGGALCFNGGFITNCIFVDNHATAHGGALACYGGGSVHSSLFISNSSTRGGAALCYNQGLFMNCVFTANRAADSGGAIFCDSFGIIRNCLAYGNFAATNGGAFSTHDSGSIVQNCTAVSNHAARGGGIHSQSGGTYYNTISYFNTAGDAPTSNWFSNVVGTEYDRSFQYCCTAPLAGLPNQSGCIDNDPLFKDTPSLNFRLHPASPCINAGLNQAWMADAVDLDGTPRVRNGRVDIGPYEYFIASLLITNIASGARLPFRNLHFITAGTCTGLAGFLSFSNTWSAGGQSFSASGSVPVASPWSIPLHLPRYGSYSFTIRGTNTYGDQLEDSLWFSRNQHTLLFIRND